ncbi:MAG: pantoate--beta-alanine ligase [Endomicrobiales bacterium]
MKVLRSPQEMQSTALRLRRRGARIGLVPTMGALHAGHLSLVERARRENDTVVVSLFVNPAQFGPREDYLRYPRPFERDRKLCREAGVDFLFAPPVEAMYPEGFRTFITVEKMQDHLCGAFRPGHFRGVATVVAKLFNIVEPGRAYFGCKDFQQVKIIERMARDLNFPLTVVACPIIREGSGLALSSRNQYLSPREHERSAALYRALQEARDLIQYRTLSKGKVIQKIKSLVSAIPGSKIDYIALCNPDTLEPVSRIQLPVLIAVAVWVGKTRLIDNILVTP